MPNVAKAQPFKLIPVMPPNKNKSAVAKPGDLSELNKPTKIKELKVPSQPAKSDNNSKHNIQTPAASIQVQEESLMLVDQAIVAIGKLDLEVIHHDYAVESKEHSPQFPSTHDKSPDFSFGERVKLTSTRETVDEQNALSYPNNATDDSEEIERNAPLNEIKVAVIPNSISEPMPEHHTIPLEIERREVCTTAIQSTNRPHDDQSRVDPGTHERSSDIPLREGSIVAFSTEASANNTSAYVSDTRQDDSITTSDLKRLDY